MIEQTNRPDNPKEIERFVVEREELLLIYNADQRGYETGLIYKEDTEDEFYK